MIGKSRGKSGAGLRNQLNAISAGHVVGDERVERLASDQIQTMAAPGRGRDLVASVLKPQRQGVADENIIIDKTNASMRSSSPRETCSPRPNAHRA